MLRAAYTFWLLFGVESSASRFASTDEITGLASSMRSAIVSDSVEA